VIHQKTGDSKTLPRKGVETRLPAAVSSRKRRGRLRIDTLIEMAHEIGYERMRLDTLPSMIRAKAIYRSLGFKEIAPYRTNPVPGALFSELDLRTQATSE